ncbi:MAG: ATP-binding protein [Lachnospiraceae bacterium]|nr:ATP-binding protein [Lachnospiraceae bacterium]
MYERSAVLLRKKFKSYLMPTILMTMALSLGSIVDSLIVANLLPTEAFSAVGLCQPVSLCFNTVFNFFGVGGATLAAIHKGRKEDDRADTVFSSVIVILLFFSAVFMIAGTVFRTPIANLLCRGNSSVAQYIRDYSFWLFLGCPFIIMVSGMIPFLRTDGSPKLASRIIIVSNVVNLVCDYLIVKFTGNIGGAAVSTVIGYAAGGLLFIPYMRSKTRGLHLTKPEQRIFLYGAKIAASGVSSGLNTGLMFLKNLCINLIVLDVLGALGVAAFNVCNQTLTLAALFVGGTVQTILPIIGVLYGEEDKTGIRMTIKTAFTFAFSAAIILCIVLEAGAGLIVGLFNLEGEAASIGTNAIRLYSLMLPFYAFNFIMINFYQTTQKKMLAAFFSIMQGLAIIVPAVFILSKIGDGSKLWLGFLISEALTFGLIWLVSRIYGRKHELKGLLLEKNCDCSRSIEMTLKNDLNDAEQVSEKISQFCKDNGITGDRALRLAIAAEELTTNIIKYGYNKDKLSYIDVNARIVGDEVVLGVRDDGVFFNPMEYHTEEMSFSGIDTVKKIAKDVRYSRVLGFNTVTVKV